MGSVLDEFRGLSYSRKKEVVQVAVLPLVSAALAFFLITPIGRGWRAEPHGLPWHLYYGFVEVLNLNPDVPVVFLTGLYLGLISLLLLDSFKKLEGAILWGMTVVAGLGLWRIDVFVTTVDWGTNAFILLIAFGLAFGGGWRRYGRSGTTDEYGRVLVVLYWLLAGVVVVGLFEAHAAYTSPVVLADGTLSLQAVQFRSVDGQGLFRNVAVGGLFLYLFGYFAQYEKETNVVLVGPQRSGKTSMMAGMNLSAQRTTDVPTRESEALTELTEQLRSEGFVAGTESLAVLPLEFTFKHGQFFPRRVTVRTIDYAGENVTFLNNLHMRSEETVTGSLDEAIDVVRYMAWESTTLSVYDREEPIGTSPDEYPALDDVGRQGLVAELLRDVLYYADRIALVLPMEDFADVAYRDGTLPPYVPTEEDGVKRMGERAPKKDYISVYNGVAKAYATSGGTYLGEEYDGDAKDILFVATFADLAKRDFELSYLEGDDSSSAVVNWPAFRRWVTERFVGDDIEGVLDKTGDALVYPVYFRIDNEDPPDADQEDVQFDLDIESRGTEPPLRGTEQLFERFGR